MKHGANIYKYAKKIRCKPNEIIDFSSNINLYHTNTNLSITDDMLVKYPDTNYTKLKNSISKKYGLTQKQIALYNGATSAIYELFKHIDSKVYYLYAPLYGEYEKAIEDNKKIIKINRFKELYKKVKKNSCVVFVNPSTPDAKHYDLDKLFKLWKAQNCTIVLDESFIEFEDLKYLRKQIKNYKKLYIIQSFSKFYACAGVRIGALFSHKSNIVKLKTPLWNISSFDSKFLAQRLNDLSFDKHSKKIHKKQKKELYKILKKSQLFSKIYKSDSNFFLTKLKKDLKIFNYLLKHKILVRKCGSFDFLNNRYLRFAVKDSYSHKQLTNVLKKYNT